MTCAIRSSVLLLCAYVVGIGQAFAPLCAYFRSSVASNLLDNAGVLLLSQQRRPSFQPTCGWMSTKDDSEGADKADSTEAPVDADTSSASAEAEKGAEEVAEGAEEAVETVEATVEETVEAGSEQAEGERQEKEEDPELVAIKKEIADLESQIKSKRSTLSYTQETVDDYSKAGYARKVAEMENMRRVRSNLNSSSRSSSTAVILSEFLPIYDKLSELQEKYGKDEFGIKYAGLTLAPTFKDMGVEEYAIEVGDKVDQFRMSVVESEHSDEYAKDTVIRVVGPGLEMKGNVMRAAECVASLGPKEEATEDEPVAEEA